ncbi:MAG: hypothetical protein ACHQET_05090 [Chitinophagales bacterium]
MEIHHHPDLKHKRKHWKEYLAEFFMIFIAVTLGFFAESLRESISENHIEKDYVRSFIADLKTDTARLDLVIPNESKAISGLDTLLTTLHQSSYSDSSIRLMYYLFRKYSMSFEPMTFNLRTYTQLRNAGGLRLIKSKAASDSIVAYNKAVDNIESIINYTTHDLMLPSIYQGNKIFDTQWLLPYSAGNITTLLKTDAKIDLLTRDRNSIAEYGNLIYLVKTIRLDYLGELKYHRDRTIKMIEFFQKEYGIE